MVERGRQQGYTFSQPDLFIAAIASIHNLCVVTRNVKDFEKAEWSVGGCLIFWVGPKKPIHQVFRKPCRAGVSPA